MKTAIMFRDDDGSSATVTVEVSSAEDLMDIDVQFDPEPSMEGPKHQSHTLAGILIRELTKDADKVQQS